MQLKHWPIFLTGFFGTDIAIIFLYRCFNQKTFCYVNHRIVVLCLFALSAFSLQAQHQLSMSKDERLYQKGNELIAHANYGAAREVFTEFLKQVPSNDSRRSEAEYYVAFSALSLGHTDGEKLIEHFIEDNPSSPRSATAYYDLADFFYNEKSYAKASTYFKKVNFPSLDNTRQNEGHFKWGYSYFSQKKLDEALEQFNFVKKQSGPYAPAANYYAGFVEYSKGQYEEAIADLKKAEQNSSYASVVPYLIANIYYKQGKYDELIQYGTSIKGRSDVANAKEVSMLVAEAYYYKGDYRNASEAYEKFLAENPEKAASALLFRAGYANYMLKQDTKAIQYLSKSASARDSASYYASYYLGILYVKQGEKPLALNSFDFARKNPFDKRLAEESWFQFGKVSYDAGKPDQAIAEFEKFLVQYPTGTHSNEVKELLAQAYVNGNNFHKAIQYIESLPTRSPHIEQAYQKATYLKGAELFNKEDYDGAIENFKKSLEYKKDPAFVAQASFWLAEAYSVQRKFTEASTHYQEVISMGASVDPDILLRTRYGLGYAFYDQKIFDRALFNFKEFVNKGNRNTPNYTDGLIRLADCYYVSKQYPEALNYYTEARNIGSNDNDYVLLQAGVISGIQKKFGDSRNQLGSLIKSYPKSQYRDEAMFQLALFEIEQGNDQQAVDGLTQLIREAPSSKFVPLAYTRRANSFFNLKQYDRAVSDYKAVITRFPSHPEAKGALVPLQEAMNAAGKTEDVDQYIQTVAAASPDAKGLDNVKFQTAQSLYYSKQYQRAITSLTSFINEYPQSVSVPEAKYLIAESHYNLKNYEAALPIYNELSTIQGFTFYNRVVEHQAEIEFKLKRYEQAISSYHKLEKVAANKREVYISLSGLMESFYVLNNYDSADVYARGVLQQGNVNAGAQNKASLYLGKTAFARGDFETAKDELLNTVNAAQDEFGAEAKYLLARISFQNKEYKQTYETIISLTQDFSAYDEWVGKAFLLLADNFLAQDNVFHAKATLQSLIDEDFPLQYIKDEARAKIAEIEKIEVEKKKKAEADTLDTDQNR
jgi:TolA-binding protein